MTTLMIVEPEATGHRMILYVRLIAAEALSRGWKVILLTSARASHHPACKAVVNEFGEDLEVVLMPDSVPGGSSQLDLLRAQISSIRAFQAGHRAVSRRQTIDFVYLPYFNYIDKVVGWYGSPFGDSPFGGMVVAATFHHRKCGITREADKRDRISEWLFRLALRARNLRLLTSIDEPLADYVLQSIPTRAGKFRYVPDVSSIRRPSERTAARAAYGFSTGDFVVASYGALSPRKGLAKLLTLFGAPDLPAHFRLLLVGAQNADAKRMVSEFLSRHPQLERQLVIVDEFVGDVEEGHTFACADVVWLCYENFSGMSGVLIQSAQAGVPVVTAGYGLIERNRQKHGLGIRWTDFAMSDGVGVRFDWPRLIEAVAAMRGTTSLLEFAAAHTPQAFGRNVIDAIVAAQTVSGTSERRLVS
ncbi:glycosyltransferase involved in cell wall biosynthesis [Paraburkholderia sp. EB58]|jgi:glycosyltransferase involved in cell wall biosynthesis|uniref:hypothetical protein n=1 Tax=Paraburkholderia sp. EB58 TaxID=3035125 RepID=UPI003D242BEE